MNTNDLTATAHYAQAFAMSDNRPTLDDLEGDLSWQFEGMTPCPNACGSRFHGESIAYHRHLELNLCGKSWG